MDIEKLIETLRQHGVPCVRAYGRYCSVCDEAADALSTLQAENEKLRAELEQVKRERDAAQSLLAERIGVRGAEPITTAFGLPIDRLRELAEADREGRCVVQEFIPGGEVWVVERDEDGEATEVSCFVFVVSVSGVAIVSPSINGYSDLDFILYDFVAETAGSFSGDFSGYPISDCYKSYEEAEAALQGEQEEKQ